MTFKTIEEAIELSNQSKIWFCVSILPKTLIFIKTKIFVSLTGSFHQRNGKSDPRLPGESKIRLRKRIV